MKKMISCLAILILLSTTVSCGIIEDGRLSENVSPTSKATTTATTNASEDENTTTTTTKTEEETNNSVKTEAETSISTKTDAEQSNASPTTESAADNSKQNELVLNEADRLFGGYVETQGDTLNLRKEPFTTADILATIPSGTQIDVYSCGKTDWYCTSYNGKTGYVSAEYVKAIGSSDQIVGSETANSYGYYSVIEQPKTSMAVSDLTGTWHCGDDTITFYNCSWGTGSFDMKTSETSVQGNVYLEYSLSPDNIRTIWYNLYDNNGTFVIGFYAGSGIQLTDIYAGQSGEPHYTRPLEN